MKSYFVKYKMYDCDLVKGINVLANNKADAWEKATYEDIPAINGSIPYCAWVESVTYSNGNHKVFNTFEGMPY